MHTKPAHLVLADGAVFTGAAFGADGAASGELVFTTGMTGYQETLTDPSYAGQIVCQTFPAIGNCGVNGADSESPGVWPAAYVVREWCRHPSNFRCEESIDAWLKEKGVPGIYGIDTRALTRRLRRHGTINAALLPALPADMPAFLAGLAAETPLAGAVYRVTPRQAVTHTPAGGARHRVVLYDYGAKHAITRRLLARGCEVVAVAAATPAAEAAALAPDGIVLSNGPGNPAEYTALHAIVRQLCGLGKPLFGICIGHQLLALASGAKTEKLPFGHRGANQPVTTLATGRTFVTSQNHGFAVVEESLPAGVTVSHRNANDGSVEGLEYPALNAFSIQFHPEACAGPEDTEYLFDKFAAML